MRLSPDNNLTEQKQSPDETFAEESAAIEETRGEIINETHAAKDVSFAKGLNFYKLFWIFFVSSVGGFIVETLYCLIMFGVLESRRGLLFGPFSQIYGFGAVLMVILLTPLSRKKDILLFAGSALLGGAFEFFCSYFQEMTLGTVSWDYSHEKFSIGGRTGVKYLLFWGFMGLVFIKCIYPAASRLIERIPSRGGLPVTRILAVLLALDVLLSAAAVYRWARRLTDFPPRNVCEVFLDEHFGDELMIKIYPNMKPAGSVQP